MITSVCWFCCPQTGCGWSKLIDGLWPISAMKYNETLVEGQQLSADGKTDRPSYKLAESTVK